jgi:hypothetical protein
MSMTGYQWAKRTKTNQLYAELMGCKKGNKYGAKKVKLDGYTFDSKVEAKRYGELKILERAGFIGSLRVHPEFDLTVNGVAITKYKADFAYEKYDLDGNYGVVEDVKSGPTAKRRDFQLVRRLMRAIHNIDVEVMA